MPMPDGSPSLGDILRSAMQSKEKMTMDNTMILVNFILTRRINLIKLFRGLYGVGLREAKDMVEQGLYMDRDQLPSFLLFITREWENNTDRSYNSASSADWNLSFSFKEYTPPVRQAEPMRLPV